MIQHEVPSRLEKQQGRYAVILNAKAKQWTGNLHEEVLRWVPRQDLFLTDDFAQAKVIMDKLFQGDYRYILTGGGDGTVTFLINALEKAISRGMVSAESAPQIGVLRMGTGNAIARWLETEDIITSLKRWRSNAPLAAYDVNMIDDGEDLFPFAGFGWDADVINDYDSFKHLIQGTILEPTLTGFAGYATAVSVKTIPQHLFKPAKKIVVTALDEVIQIRSNGDEITRFKSGDVIFEGDSKIFGCGSMPYWGYNIRMFPYANQYPDMFHFRTFNGPVSQILFSLRRVWKGEISKGCHDFLCKHVKVDIVDASMSYQVAGDPRGRRRSVEWKLYGRPVTLVTPLSLKMASMNEP